MVRQWLRWGCSPQVRTYVCVDHVQLLCDQRTIFAHRLSRIRTGLAGVLSGPGWLQRTSPMCHPVLLLVLLTSLLFRFTGACSSRSTPKPRAPSPTMRPNITFQTYACPEAYAKWYCLNGATCFAVKIRDSILYNCECADGYMGQRCEFKDLDGSYLPARERVMIEKASIASGAAIAILLVFVISIAFYIYVRRWGRIKRLTPVVITHRKYFLTQNTLRDVCWHHAVTLDPDPGYSGSHTRIQTISTP
ncbi:protein spitz-like [Centruroides vittatus]|uniref:protein spitz-like n=1 Tax=Centruroides sculpturatus TaxID=218467 RepID=UPI000C6D2B25|nr:protein spitz-like [Centruroides sculpturatus]